MKGKLTIWLLALLCCACASYYQVNRKFNRHFEEGELAKADQVLAGSKKAAEGRTQLLYYLNRGTIAALQGQYTASNQFFEQAYRLGEDLRNNYWNVASSYLLNPMFSHYTGEDHELLLIHYYKALNFLQLEKYSSALVECRRLNIKLNKMATRYPGQAQKYHRDAFIHTLMGLIYDASGDANNAFIAYRNAVEIYQEDYQPLFGLGAPEQLQEDLLRTAHQMNFTSELRHYEKEFGKTYQPREHSGGDLVFFWNSGLGPVKSEWSVNFALVRGEGGIVHFRNQQLGWNFPFRMNSEEEYEEKGLNQLEFVRVAFPQYQERPLRFRQASLRTAKGQSFALQAAEDINAIAFQSLQQRMLREFSTSLLRVAIKKATEHGLRQKNDDLGAVLGAVNALTERADTRNWQTIPHTIYYRRVPLPVGEQKVTLTLRERRLEQTHSFTFRIRKNQTTFRLFRSLETDNYPLLSGTGVAR